MVVPYLDGGTITLLKVSNRKVQILRNLVVDKTTSTKTPGYYCELKSDIYQFLPGNVRKIQSNTFIISHAKLNSEEKEKTKQNKTKTFKMIIASLALVFTKH